MACYTTFLNAFFVTFLGERIWVFSAPFSCPFGSSTCTKNRRKLAGRYACTSSQAVTVQKHGSSGCTFLLRSTFFPCEGIYWSHVSSFCSHLAHMDHWSPVKFICRRPFSYLGELRYEMVYLRICLCACSNLIQCSLIWECYCFCVFQDSDLKLCILYMV